MFKVKVCGVTRDEDVRVLAQSGADAIGINLVTTSPRCVTLARARSLRDLANSLGLQVVIVLMDPTSRQVAQAITAVLPDMVQLHGHEQPECLPTSARGLPIIKALSWTGRAEESQLAQLWWQACGDRLAFLVDAYAPGVGGGTGKLARWDLLWPRPEPLGRVPLLLAGGLKPENVAEGILATRCDGVDTASGVESAPGIKDPQLTKAFAAAALAVMP